MTASHDQQVILDPTLASVGSGIPVRTIQRWVLRGWLTDYGDGQYLRVELGELVALAERRSNTPGKRPRLRNPSVMA